MKSSITFTTGRARAIAPVLTLFFLVAVQGYAQTWETTYGTGLIDQRRGVTPVTLCAGGGYIAVADIPGTSNDVYVVRVNNAGATLWERAYDITGNNDVDQGWGIVELANGTGFVITGHTNYVTGPNAGDVDAFLLKISCSGAVVWSQTYGHPLLAEFGRSVIETTTGNAAAGTAAGNLVVAGFASSAGQCDDGLLFRTTNVGALIWDMRYDDPPGSTNPTCEAFYDLVELTPQGGNPTGDILAVGGMTIPGSLGFVIRTNGDNGFIGAAPQGAALYGNPTQASIEFFYGALEQQNPTQVGANGLQDVIIIGEANSEQDIYVMKIPGGDICGVLPLEAYIGINGHKDVGYDIQEVRFAPGAGTAVQQWDLVATGFHDDPVTADPAEVLLLDINPATLAPQPLSIGSVFNRGGTPGFREEGWSLAPVAAGGGRTFGFIVNGFSTSGAPGTGDMYMIKTNGAGNTACSTPYSPTASYPASFGCVTPLTYSFKIQAARSTLPTPRHTWMYVCPWTAIKEAPSAGDEMILDGTLDVTVGANPVAVGVPVDLTVITPEERELDITITNSLGETTARHTTTTGEGAGRISLPTGKLTPGVYNVTLSSGADRVTARFVVVE